MFSLAIGITFVVLVTFLLFLKDDPKKEEKIVV